MAENLTKISAFAALKFGFTQFQTEPSVDDGRHAAELCTLNLFAHLAAVCSDQIGRVVQAVRVAGIVNCGDDFANHPAVLDGASELIVRILGDQGRHTRIATGTTSLPSRMAIEIEAVFQIRD